MAHAWYVKGAVDIEEGKVIRSGQMKKDLMGLKNGNIIGTFGSTFSVYDPYCTADLGLL